MPAVSVKGKKIEIAEKGLNLYVITRGFAKAKRRGDLRFRSF